MRITAIELENFKGISDWVRVDLKPITLLFGANSAGKSTILHALQYFREILERRNANPDHTLYGGEFVDLGGFRNLVNGRDASKPIKMKLTLDMAGEALPDLMPSSWDDAATSPDESVYEYNWLLQETLGLAQSVSVELEIGWNSSRGTAVIVGYRVDVNNALLAQILASADGRDATITINPQNPIFIREFTAEELELDKELLVMRGEDDQPSPPESTEESGHKPDVPTTSEVETTHSVWKGILYTVIEAGMEKPGVGLRNWLTGFDGALPHLGQLLDIPADGIHGADNIYVFREFTSFVSSLVIGPGVVIRDQLRQLRYLGPIRNVPDRDFHSALTPDEARWADGTAAWDALLTDDTMPEDTLVPIKGAMLNAVSRWMSDPEKLGTGYGIEREIYREVDTASLTALIRAADPDAGGRIDPALPQAIHALPEKRRLFLVDNRLRQRMAAKDVGIGISQVLPVVVAALEPSASLVCIEQPELHIHPAIQVGLGDLFIDGALKRGTQFLIETHSEHLILRLLRRVRETTDGELPPGLPEVKPEHVGVLYVDNGEGGMRITPLPIDETGEFTERWPRGFFVEREDELFGFPPEGINDELARMFPR